jgi:hypothetical protein
MKLSYRKLQAVYKLRLWGRSRLYLADCEVLGLDAAIVKTYRHLLEMRLAEQNGSYKPKRNAGVWEDIDMADYHGPIAVKSSRDLGRYMVVTEDVEAGTLLCVEKAGFKSIDTPGLLVQTPHVTRSTLESNNYLSAHHIQCNAIHALIADPSRLLIADGLSPGNTRETPYANEEERWELIRRGLALAGRVSLAALVDKSRTNSFGNVNEDGPFWMKLFGMGSMINHSCLGNVVHHMWGEVSSIPVDSLTGELMTIRRPKVSALCTI